MNERLKKIAKAYDFKINENPTTVFLNRNLLGGRFTRSFTRHDDPDDNDRLERLITIWLQENGPRLRTIQQEYLEVRGVTP